MVRMDGFLLGTCPHCGSMPKFVRKERDRHVFWRVACMNCGCGTWCDTDGYGHMDRNGKALSVAEWNARTG